MQIVLLTPSTRRAKTPSTLLAWFGTTCILQIWTASSATGFRSGDYIMIGLHVERLQPGSPTMVTCKRHPLTKMWCQMRPSQFSR